MDCVTIEKLAKEKCSGCGACAQLCPVQCISMKEDIEGFYYPVVDSAKCISCGKCLKQCPQYNVVPGNQGSSCYAVIHNNREVLKTSTSGGAFSLFAKEILEKGGVVYGCAMEKENDTFVVKHIRVDDFSGLEKLKGSKYVQSIIGNTFLEAKKDLEQNRMILYSGTPCQIAGLKAFLQKDYSNLITCEVICHGVPSQKLFQKNIAYLEQKGKFRILNFKFRSKAREWAMYWEYSHTAPKTGEKSEVVIADKNPYYMAFLNGDCYRESCYLCSYAKKDRVADITMGDYWGVEEFEPEFADPNGVSLVLLNNLKAENFFVSVKKEAKAKKVQFSSASLYNKNLISPTVRSKRRDFAYRNLDMRVDELFDQYPYKISIKQRIKAHLKGIVSVRQKWMIKRFIKGMKSE